jgi:hypothetical protein
MSERYEIVTVNYRYKTFYEVIDTFKDYLIVAAFEDKKEAEAYIEDIEDIFGDFA